LSVTSPDRIELQPAALLDRVHEAVASERNACKGKSHPAVTVCMEDPIAWAVLFGFDANRYLTDPAFYFEQVLRQKLWLFDNVDDDTPITLDVPAWLGHYPEFTFFGMDVSVSAKGVPRISWDHPLSRNPDLALLNPVDFHRSGWMPRALRWYDDLCALAAGRANVSFMTWNRGCLDLAVQLRGYETSCIDAVKRPRFVHDLMGFLAEQRNTWYDARAAHLGAQLGVTWVADDWIGLPYTSPEGFAEFVLPRYLEIEAHHGGVASVHSCGDQTRFQAHLLKIESLDVLEASPWTDLRQTLTNVPPSKHLHISVHPNDVLVASPAEMEAKLCSIAEACSGRRYSVATSGLTPIYDDNDEFLRRINRWLHIARKALNS
jgi:hypothetical protein